MRAILRITTLLLLCGFLSAPAIAADLRPYLFASAGIAQADLGELEDRFDVIIDQASDNGGTSSMATDDRDTVATLGLGLRLHRHFAIELGYYLLGNYDIEAQGRYTNGIGRLTRQGTAQVDVRGWGAQGVILAPLTERFSATLSLGLAELETEISGRYRYHQASPLGQISREEEFDTTLRNTVANLGVGARYAIGDALSLRLDYRYLGGIGGQYEAQENIHSLSAGLIYHFF